MPSSHQDRHHGSMPRVGPSAAGPDNEGSRRSRPEPDEDPEKEQTSDGATIPRQGRPMTTVSLPILTPPKQTPPLALVIFGASGDLTSRKILPALANLADRGRLNENFTVIGVARTPWSDDEFRQVALRDVPNAGEAWRTIVQRFRYVAGEYAASETFDQLKGYLA